MLVGENPQNYKFIQTFLEKEKHIKPLIKKINRNEILRNTFEKYLIDTNVLRSETLSDYK